MKGASIEVTDKVCSQSITMKIQEMRESLWDTSSMKASMI